ncbi:MAG: ATP-binding protein [Massilia sp.]
MSDTRETDFATRAGFRLSHFEVFNWGTFDQRVWRLAPAGENILLTGDIGSGKSTLVDALTTLLVAPHKLAYNKAAGADERERSLRSYVLGHYKSERADTISGTRAVALRDHHDYSVLLAVFRNEALGESVTVAQVFWIKDPHGQPERLYVVAASSLLIGEHFTGFGPDIAQLRKRLRTTAGVTVYDTFLPYGAEFRRRFGIPGEQAMDLLHQTVSMKSVGNLSDFVREHMLEPFPVEARIAGLVADFDALSRAHEAVLKAHAQIDQLTSLVAGYDRYAEQARQAELWRTCRHALRPWFAQVKRYALEQRTRQLETELEIATGKLASLAELRRSQRLRRDALVEAIATNGGNRIGQIGAEIARLERTRDERAERAQQYNRIADKLGLPAAAGAATFAANRRAIEEGLALCTERRDEASTRLTEAGVTVRELGRQHRELTAELESLRRRTSNLPRRLVEMRAALCEALGVDASELPFVGELIQVRDEDVKWEGAAERLLRDFAQALLVPDIHYRAVAAWASRPRPGWTLSYFRVRNAALTAQSSPGPDSLLRRLAVKPGSPHYAWLLGELQQQFDYVCCEDNQRFQREKRALHPDGRVKSAGERHDRDDLHPLDDRAHYTLGWTNEAKIAALAKRERDLAARIQALVSQVSSFKREVDEHNALLGAWQQLALYIGFKELDWKAPATMIEQLERERQELSTSTDTLGELTRQVDALGAEQDATEAESDETTRTHASLTGQLTQSTLVLGNSVPAEGTVPVFVAEELDRLSRDLFGDRVLALETYDRFESDLRELLQAKADDEDQRSLPLRDAVIGAMQEYVRAWPVDTREVDVSIGAGEEFRQMLASLVTQEVPTLLLGFEQLLNEDTIRGITSFHSQLQREQALVRERVATINRALYGIDYSPGRYVSLEIQSSPDVELRDFQHDLRSCIDDAPGVGETSLEARFLQVKRLVQRFRGREGSVEPDQRWTRKVTDVRNWFMFSASERWREDDREHEHYSDAAGKSGGQKEKLAYTVLAAGLACQFGREGASEPERCFRFAMIDEAFGRGSDDSARYGLELFRRMGLQLLVVTPLQKVHVIEPYVAGLGFVHSEAGQRSMLRYLGIDEYQVERSEHLAGR